jgi:hypothetical protein
MPDGSNTRRDLIDQVLLEMGLVASGQAAAPEDVSNVDRAIEPTIARYQALEIVGDFDIEQTPDEYFTPVSRLIADSLLAQYGIPHGNEADPAAWNIKIAEAANQMREMRALRPNYSVLVVNYF